MKFYITGLIMLLLMIPFSSGQTATIWGPGEDYEITYLHSGYFNLNGTDRFEFTDEPSTEIRLQNLTNEGYDYIYLGYNEVNELGTITMQSFSFGIFSFEFPYGGMPFVLPLSYGDEEKWIETFSSRLNELSNLNPDNQFLNGSSMISENLMIVEFASFFNVTDSFNQAFFNLPQLNFAEFNNANVTYINSTLTGSVSFQLNTGALFDLDITILSEDVLVDSISFGTMDTNQNLEFVAIIPPSSIIDEALNFNYLIVITIVVTFSLLRKLKNNN